MARLLVAAREPRAPLSLLDPCVGQGAFPQALDLHLGPGDEVVALDVDPQMIAATQQALKRPSHSLRLECADYLRWRAPKAFHGIIMNPPYLRQEWLDGKGELEEDFRERYGVKIPGASNAYVYFLVKALHELRPAGRLLAIVYDSWTYTRYGRWLRAHLEQGSSVLKVHAIPPQPFDGRLIDANVIELVRGRADAATPTRPRRSVALEPSSMRPIDALYETRRGLRLKQAQFFLCDLRAIREVGATQFLKHIRHVEGYAASSQHPQAALLIRPEEERPELMAELQRRLAAAKKDPQRFESILTWARERPKSWFCHPPPPRAPILFNYYIRDRAKHIFSHGIPYADNFYGLTPRSPVAPAACQAALNSSYTVAEVERQARPQGNGLRKLQLFEYRRVRTPAVHLLDASTQRALGILGQQLATGEQPSTILRTIDEVLEEALGFPSPASRAGD